PALCGARAVCYPPSVIHDELSTASTGSPQPESPSCGEPMSHLFWFSTGLWIKGVENAVEDDVDDLAFSTAAPSPVHALLTTLGMTGVSYACRPPSPLTCATAVEESVD